MADRLPNVPQGKAYQLWFIVGNNPPMPGKTFVPDSAGKGMMKDQMPAGGAQLSCFCDHAGTCRRRSGSDRRDLSALIRDQLISQKLLHSHVMNKGKKQNHHQSITQCRIPPASMICALFCGGSSVPSIDSGRYLTEPVGQRSEGQLGRDEVETSQVSPTSIKHTVMYRSRMDW